jgi:hypothetical protein
MHFKINQSDFFLRKNTYSISFFFTLSNEYLNSLNINFGPKIILSPNINPYSIYF